MTVNKAAQGPGAPRVAAIPGALCLRSL